MTTPTVPRPLADMMVARDPSLPLAAAALARVADDQGQAAFMDLAVAYREEFLKLRAHALTADLPELGALSVEEFRASLGASVLPRLALGKVVTYAAPLGDRAPVAFTPEAWAEVAPDRAGAADRLYDAAERALTRAESSSGPHAAVSGASRLEARGLVKIYKGRRVVNDVSVQLEQGEIVGLLGPNGAGKTTCFYMITGLIRPDGGQIVLDDRDITAEPMYRRARMGIGYLAQEPSVFRKLTVEENVRAILETLPLSAGEQAERLERLLDELAIKHLRRQKAFQLSGGERRRLEITRALVTEPKFMLLDEPFAGVDPIAVHDIQTIVAGLRHRGIGVLITDHNVEQTLDIVDRAYIMFEGKVKVAGTVRELVFDDRVANLYLGPTLTARLRTRLGQLEAV
jgi:lipopolysaccharide export system ATP-binding protein